MNELYTRKRLKEELDKDGYSPEIINDAFTYAINEKIVRPTNGRFTKEDIGKVAEYIENILNSRHRSAVRERVRKLNLEFSKHQEAITRASAKELAGIIEPVIKQDRQIYLDSENPFKNAKQAAQWLFNKQPFLHNIYSLLQTIKGKPRKEQFYLLFNTDKALFLKYSNSSSKQVPSTKRELLVFLQGSVDFWLDGYLDLLYYRTFLEFKKKEKAHFTRLGLFERMLKQAAFWSKSVCWTEFEMLVYFLLGDIPKIEPATALVNYGVGLQRKGIDDNYKWITITIRNKALSAKDLTRLYRSIQKQIKLAKKPPVTKEQQKKQFIIADFVGKNKGLTWEQKTIKWNRAYPQWRFDTSDGTGLGKAYRRYIRRVQNQF